MNLPLPVAEALPKSSVTQIKTRTCTCGETVSHRMSGLEALEIV